ncbi:MAG: hypothetical protein K2H20_03155 [Bacilli bacterium]|nr:hypothetical protein [Bacilli bacterium]
MPYIHTRTNTEISKEKELRIKTRLGEAIRLLGKSEDWLMLDFSENCHMYYAGNDSERIAYVDIKVYGKGRREAFNSMTQEVTNIISEELEVMPDHIYVSYGEYENWGWNGNNF